MKTLKEYDVESLKNYNFNMYEKRYRQWEVSKCFYMDDNNQRVEI